MSTTTTMQVSSIRAIGKIFGWILPVVNFLSTFAYINMGGWRVPCHPRFPIIALADGFARQLGAQRATEYRVHTAQLSYPAEQCAHEPFDRNRLFYLCVWCDHDLAFVS